MTGDRDPDRPVPEPADELPAPEQAAAPEPEEPVEPEDPVDSAEPEESVEPEVTAEPEEPGEAPEDATPAEADAAASATATASSAPAARRRRSRDPLASALIAVLTLLLGFAFAVQVRSADQGQGLAGAREEDLVRILDEVNAREERLREQINEQRTALQQLTSTDSTSATALDEARRRAQAIGILNGTLAAHGPGLRMTVRDADGGVRVEDVLDAIEELRGAGAETMQIDGVRVGVSTAVTGTPGHLLVDGRPITAPYEFLVIGEPQNMETAMNIPGGVVQRITGLGGSVHITQLQDVVVDALRPLDTPQYASPQTGK
ncbi:MAG: DUF881 domain-containing protein [Blastococcus sp.]